VNINQAFPSKYLRAADLQDRAHVLTITRCIIEDVGGEGNSEHKPVVYFKETDKGIVLNKTNAMAVEYAHGPETDNWIDKQIEAFPDTVLFQNRMVPCIRLRKPMPAAGAASLPAAAPMGTLGQPLGGTEHDERNPPDIDESVPF